MPEFTADGLNLQGLATAINFVAETIECGTVGCHLRDEINRLRKIAYRINQFVAPYPNGEPLPFRLTDHAGGGGGLSCRIDLSGGCIVIMPDGHATKTDADGHGTPIVVELYDGKLQILAWADINQEDPTHAIDMDGAREILRKE
jgi:hypothetical protein